jgi:hypothetical protein
MGVIRIGKIIENIDNITEEEIKEIYISTDETNTQNWDFDNLLVLIRKRSLFIDYMLWVDYEKAKILFTKILNAFKIKNIDIDEKVNFIRINAKREPVKTSDWEFSTMPLTSDSKEDKVLTCCSAGFKYANKWGEGTASSKEIIIHDENRQVIWIKNDYRKPSRFLSFDNKIYAIELDHKNIIIHKNIDIITKKIIVNQIYDNLDDIIKEYDHEKNKCEDVKIDLSDYFPVGFFYRGPKWTREWRTLYPDGIIYIREITIVNRLIKIEIENIAYPHKGYALLDLENEKVMEAKKYEEETKQLRSGVFWILSDNYDLGDYEFLMFDIPCDPNGKPDNTHSIELNSKSGNTYNHKKLWESEVKNNNKYRPYSKKDYNYYPRGRVEISHNKAIIYLSSHVNKKNFIDIIKENFGLFAYNIPEVRVITDGSDHYQCFLDWN